MLGGAHSPILRRLSTQLSSSLVYLDQALAQRRADSTPLSLRCRTSSSSSARTGEAGPKHTQPQQPHTRQHHPQKAEVVLVPRRTSPGYNTQLTPELLHTTSRNTWSLNINLNTGTIWESVRNLEIRLRSKEPAMAFLTLTHDHVNYSTVLYTEKKLLTWRVIFLRAVSTQLRRQVL